MKEKYLYSAIFEYAEDGINVSFPDLPEALTCGDNTEEALRMAKECLELTIYGREEDGEDIPTPSRIKSTKENESVVLIEAYMPTVRMEMENKAVKKMVSLPHWLANQAQDRKINLSKTLQAALYQQMNLPFAPQKRKPKQLIKK